MKQAFVSIVSSYVGCCVACTLRDRGYNIVGSTRKEDIEDIQALVTRTVDANDLAGAVRLALASDVVVLCLLEDIRGADAILTALQVSRHEEGRPSHLLMLSTTMTWAKTKPSSMSSTLSAQATESSRALCRPGSMMTVNTRPPPGVRSLPRASTSSEDSLIYRGSSRQIGASSSKKSSRSSAHINNRMGASSPGAIRRRQHGPQSKPVTENDFLARQPPTGYLEHKRLEVAALSLQSPDLSTCVVGAGVPYGLGEGPLLRVFRDAWRGGDEAVLMPTCAAGDNRLALVYVLDLSNIVANLLPPADRQDNPLAAPFPKPYVLAVDGDGAQCTMKELTSAIGRAFGGKGNTQAMGEEELEEMLVEDPMALALMIDVRFANNGGVAAGMVADGQLKPLAWSKGFVASAGLLAQEFVSSRSLNPIRAVIVGPPGGCQGHVCEQISQRYGIMYVDAKVAADSVFEALGKPLPEPLPPDEKAVPPVKGKKGKDTSKKGASKTGELNAEAQAARAALSPTERLLHDMQAAFEVAGVPFSEYTTIDTRGLARLLPPSVVARSARLLLERTWRRWAPSGFILCDIPSCGDEASDLFAALCISRPSSRNGAGSSRPVTASTRSNISTPPDPASQRSDLGEFRPTNVLYLHATADFISAMAAQQGGVTGFGGGGKDTEATVRSDLECFFSEEQKQLDAEDAAALLAAGGTSELKKHEGGEGNKDSRASVGSGLDDEDTASPVRWIPATIRALRNKFQLNIEVIDAAQEDVSRVLDAVDLQLTGGQVPAFVWMLGGEGGGGDEREGDAATAAEAEETVGGEALAGPNTVKTREAGAPSELDTFQSEEVEDSGPASDVGLMEVLSRLTARDAKEVEARTRRHRRFLTDGVVPQVAAGLVAAAEARPADPFEFLGDYLIRAGRTLQSTAEAEAALKYREGLALLQEMEERDNKLGLGA